MCFWRAMNLFLWIKYELRLFTTAGGSKLFHGIDAVSGGGAAPVGGVERSAGSACSTFSREGEARHFHVHAGRCVARRFVRLQAEADRSGGEGREDERKSVRSPAVGVQTTRAIRGDGQRVVPEHREFDGRHLPDPLDAR